MHWKTPTFAELGVFFFWRGFGPIEEPFESNKDKRINECLTEYLVKV